ncbi:hypothetical protein KC959_02405 [Candidatus Saccharibacteria bacterium]|nr:hypothetical protein [Candidatus Saccharibacteria bacterium]
MKTLKSFVAVSYMLLLTLVAVPFFTIPASAAACNDFDKTVLGIPTWYKYLQGEDVSGKCRPIINASKDALPIGLAVLEAAMTLGGLVAVVMIFVGSFKFVIAQGESKKITEAKNTVINSVVGLVIIIISTRIVSFIAGRIG